MWIIHISRKKDPDKSLSVRNPFRIACPLKIKPVYPPDSLNNKSENKSAPAISSSPTASISPSEKGRIRFPVAVALKNQRQCFFPQWYPKLHQDIGVCFFSVAISISLQLSLTYLWSVTKCCIVSTFKNCQQR